MAAYHAVTALNQNMTRISESAPSAQHRLRRIEGRHNALVKDLRQAFARAERTEDGNCAIEGLRIVEEAIRSGLRFRAVFFKESAQNLAERLLPQIGANVDTLLLPDKLFDNTVPSETPQGVAALVRLKEFSLADVLERLQVGPVIVLAGLQDPGQSRNNPAFGRSLWQRGRRAGRRHGQSIEFQSDSRFGGIAVPAAGRPRESGGRPGRDFGRSCAAQSVRSDRDVFAQRHAARSGESHRAVGQSSSEARARACPAPCSRKPMS